MECKKTELPISADVKPLRKSVKVGDTVRRRPVTFSDMYCKTSAQMEGRVVYVHPRGRFHVVEFPGAIGTIREAFFGTRR